MAGADILQDCTIGVDRGEIAVIVGPNGAGKSTAMKAVFGMLNLRRGGAAGRRGYHRAVAAGPGGQGHGLRAADQNIFTSHDGRGKPRDGRVICARDDFSETMAQVYDLFPILKEKRRQAAGELRGGQRQQVAVGRALMTQPKVLMLDEPTAGVSPIVMDELFDRIIEVRAPASPILMVEQNARQALEIADKGYVLVQGRNALYRHGQGTCWPTRKCARAFWGDEDLYAHGKIVRILFVRQICIALAFAALTVPHTASAGRAPGPLPHTCNPYAACEDSGACVGISAPLPSVVMEKTDTGLAIKWDAQRTTPIKKFETLADAKAELVDGETGHPATWIFIVPNAEVADALGYDLYTIGVRGNGVRVLSKTFLKLACS